VNKVFGKRSSLLLAFFFKFFITTRLPLHRMHAKSHHLQRDLRQAGHHLHLITYGFSSQIMSYLLHMLIWVGMILLDNLLQCLLLIIVIDLSRICDSTTILIYNLLVVFMIYPWIKIKAKVLIFPTIQKSYYSQFSFMDGFVDGLKPMPFTGVNFKRWHIRVTLWLTAMNVF
jgi:hypothetical protein